MSAPAAVRRRLRHWAGLAVGWGFETLGGPPPGLPVAGAGPQERDARPVAIVVLLGADGDTVASTARDLAAAAAAGGPRPLLVIDRPHFAAARRNGVAVDHVLPAEEWAARGYPQPWAAYYDGELRRLRRDFRTSHVVELPPTGSRAIGEAQLRARLTPPSRPWAPVRAWRRALVNLERRIDRPRD